MLPFQSLNSVTSEADGTESSDFECGLKTHTLVATASGLTSETGATVALEGSLDGETWFQLASGSVGYYDYEGEWLLANPLTLFVANIIVRYVRASTSNYSGTPAISAWIQSGG
jgi:hypothetical protein